MRISCELREYAVDPEDLAAETVVAKIGLPAEQAAHSDLVEVRERRDSALGPNVG